jgi:zinc transport system ATP-binding protein
MTAEPMISLTGVSVSYGGVVVLEDVSLEIASQDFVGIIGPNGGGKTTLLKVMLGLVNPEKGEVSVMGEKPEKGRRHIGYVPQRSLFNSDFPISVNEAVLMGRYPLRGPFHYYRREDRLSVGRALRSVGMEEYAGRQIGQLSGGQQQRVFIARALVANPAVLLLDEPTASVDPSLQGAFYDLLKELSRHMAVVMVSHDISAVSIYVDKVVCLNRKLFYHGPAELSAQALADTYQCPLQFISHGHFPHRVLEDHRHD